MASRRFSSRATRDLSLEQLVSPLPELGLVAANGPNDPEPELVVVDGEVVRMDGRDASEFDVIDRFVVAHGLDLAVAKEAMALEDLAIARMLVDVDIPRSELVHLGILYRREVPIPLSYRGHHFDDSYRIDFIVADRLVLEVKSVQHIERVHQAQLLTYLRLTGIRTGLLLNFNTAVLRHGILRLRL